MTIQEKLNSIKDYFVSIDMYEGRWAVCVKYRPKWGAYPKEDGSISIEPGEDDEDMWWYIAKNDSVDIDTIIAFIEETIQTNIDAIKKVELFKEKAKELKAIFSDETKTFKELSTLRFVFDGYKVNTKPSEEEKPAVATKKVASKKDIIAKAGSEISQENVFAVKTEKVEEKPVETKRKPGRKKANQCIQEEDIKTVGAEVMSEAEIDSLRG